jgi:hypothetical protein
VIFRICKFRTMVKNADALGGKINGCDPRITPSASARAEDRRDAAACNILRERCRSSARARRPGLRRRVPGHYNAIHSVIGG